MAVGVRNTQAHRWPDPPAWWLQAASCVRQHEGWWTANTGNGYYGAYQFAATSWWAVGGRGYASQASPGEQTYRAWLLYEQVGWSAWPNTSRLCGLR